MIIHRQATARHLKTIHHQEIIRHPKKPLWERVVLVLWFQPMVRLATRQFE